MEKLEELEKIEKQSFEENDSIDMPPLDIVAYNELRSCADLFRMHTDAILEIQPEFEREIVWRNPAQTRFIDSLIKQLPIPSMCFSLDYKSEKWKVIDGLQRMATIIKFLSGETWTLSKLDDIDPKISGKSISFFFDRKSDLNKLLIRVQNLTLPVTVLRCDYSKKNHMNYLFTIFHRLNTGGMKLNNQEIRNCIYSGELKNLLKELNTNTHWRKINKMKKKDGYRFTKQELILRFFAFHDKYNSYEGKLARFLNDYMSENRTADTQFLSEKMEIFNRTVKLIDIDIFGGQILRKLSITVLEALLVGVASNIDFLESLPGNRIKGMYRELVGSDELSEQNLIEGLSSKKKVIARIRKSKSIFRNR